MSVESKPAPGEATRGSASAVSVEVLTQQIRRFAAGTLPDTGFRLLFDTYYPRLTSFFRAKSRCSPADAEELTQETLKRVYRHHGRLREICEIEQFQVWLFEVAANVLRNWLRDRRAEKRRGIEQSLDVEEQAMSLLAEVARAGSWPASDPLTRLLDREQVSLVARAIRELPDKMQRCVRLFYGDGLRVKDIATVTGVQVNTVKAQLHQGRNRLRELLGSLFDDPRTEDDAE